MIRPDNTHDCPCESNEYKGIKTRIEFTLNGFYHNIGCTDIRWRAYMRNAQNRKNSINLLNNRDTYFTIGLTRKPWNGQIWPMVVGLHVLPDINIEIDYNNL